MNTHVSVTQHGGWVVLMARHQGGYPELSTIEFDIHMPILYKHRTARLWDRCRQTPTVINHGVWHVPEAMVLAPNATGHVNQEGLKTTLLRACKFAAGQQESLRGAGVSLTSHELLTTMATHVRFGCSWYVTDLCDFLYEALNHPDIAAYAKVMRDLATEYFPAHLSKLTTRTHNALMADRAKACESMLQRAYATLKDLGMTEQEIDKTLAPPDPNAGTPTDKELPKT